MPLDPRAETALIAEMRYTKRDGEDFAACLRRATAKRFEAVRDLGDDGVRLCLLADDVRFELFCPPGEVPADAGCPWDLPAGVKPAAVVRKVLGPLSRKIPKT